MNFPAYIFLCPDCGTNWPPQTVECMNCFIPAYEMQRIAQRRHGQHYGSDEYRTFDKKREPLVRFPQIEQPKSKYYPFADFENWQQPRDSNTTIEGMAGSGKSTLVSRIAFSLSSRGIPVLYLSSEEQLNSDTFIKRMIRVKNLLQLPNVPMGIQFAYIEDTRAWHDYEESFSEQHPKGFVIVDSLSVLMTDRHRPNEQWLNDKLLQSPHGYCFVEHLTTNQNPKGGYRISYAVDVIIKAAKKGNKTIANVKKSRFGVFEPFDIHEPKQIHSERKETVIEFPKRENYE